MSNIYVISSGNGSAYVDNPYPNNGEIVTIYAYPASGEQILDLYMQDQNGYYIAVSQVPVQQISYDASWGDCTITVQFSSGGGGGDIITVNVNGNGMAHVDNANPSDGDTVYLYSFPGGNKYILTGIDCYDSNMNLLWTANQDTVSFTYDGNWGNITIEVYFDMKWIFKNLWILKVAQDWRFR